LEPIPANRSGSLLQDLEEADRGRDGAMAVPRGRFSTPPPRVALLDEQLIDIGAVRPDHREVATALTVSCR
jgi:hypothetical protein